MADIEQTGINAETTDQVPWSELPNSDIRSRTPAIWTDADGIEVALSPMEHMEGLGVVFFYGPVTEWKETIDGKYIWTPAAFDKATPDEEESLEGHFNNEGTNLYPKLITSLNKSDITLEKINQTMKDINHSNSDGSNDVKIFREGKYLYFQQDNTKRKVLVHLWGPVFTILLTVLFLKTEGKLLESFTIKRHDIPMETLGMEPTDAEKYYEAKGKNPSLTIPEWRDAQDRGEGISSDYTRALDEGNS